MSSIRWSSLVLIAGLVLGCHNLQKKEEAKGPAPATPQTVREIREAYVKVNANARVGLVVAVRAESRLVAVADIPVQDFKINDAITFVDTANKILGNGVVENIVGDTLHVRYVEPEEGQRPPQVGDLAVRVK